MFSFAAPTAQRLRLCSNDQLPITRPYARRIAKPVAFPSSDASTLESYRRPKHRRFVRQAHPALNSGEISSSFFP